MFYNINNCHNTKDFRYLAKKRLPKPIFHYIDGAADDVVTYRRNTEAYEQCDLIPNVLAGVENIDMSTTVMGQKINMPNYLSPTALQRLFHHQGEIAVGKADVDPSTCLFIDDNKENVIGAESAGFLALRYRNTLQLQLDLKFLGIN